MTITFALSRADFVKGKRRGYFRSPYTWVIALVAVGAASGYAGYMSSKHNSGWYLPLLVVGVMAGVLFVVGPGRAWDRSAALQDPRTITLDSFGLHLTGSFPKRDRAWSAYRSVFEYDDMYVLHYRDNSTTIPKAAFITPSDELKFREAMKSHVNCHFAKTD